MGQNIKIKTIGQALVAQTFNPSTKAAEAASSLLVQGQPDLQSKF